MLATARLEDVLDALIDYRGKTPTKTDSGIRLITAKVIKDGFINDSSREYIADDAYDAWMRRGLPKRGDLLVTTEAPLGEVAELRGTERVALAQRVILLRANAKKMDQRFLFHAFKSPFVQAELRKRATGTTVLGIKQSELRQIEVPVPPLPIQRRIADILSAYDDLIENNTKRIKILEEMARSIYREWFVNFRFPRHEKVKMVASPLGEIPEGWRVRPLRDLAAVTYGFPFKSKLFNVHGAGTPVIRIRDLAGEVSSTWTTELAQERHLVCNGDVLIGMDGIFHMAKWSSGKSWLNQRVAMVRPVSGVAVSRYFLFLALEGPIHYFEATISGTTVAHLSDEDFRSISILTAPSALQARFDEVVDGLFEQELVLKKACLVLRQTRDLLLPRLISGEVRVAEPSSS
jgi:type I restriction enzyme S subunit